MKSLLSLGGRSAKERTWDVNLGSTLDLMKLCAALAVIGAVVMGMI
ncbi:hypothetical protein [Aquabacter sp. CN5-332]